MHFIRNDNAEILLKVALNTITLTPYIGHDIYLTDFYSGLGYDKQK
jgi:hypothetical protein